MVYSWIVGALGLLLLSGCASTSPNRPTTQSDLRRAAYSGDIAHMTLALSQGVDPNASSRNGARAIHAAVAGGQTRAVEFLINEKADLDVLTASGASPLSMAAGNGNLPIVERLLKAGADPDLGVPLYAAAGIDRADVVEILLAGGADPNMYARSGMTALHAAVVRGNTDIVRLLLANGGNPDVIATRSDLTVTPRDIADAANRRDILLLLGHTDTGDVQPAPSPASPPQPVTVEHVAAEHVTRGPLAQLKEKEIRKIAAQAIAKQLPATDLRTYAPAYIIWMKHDSVHSDPQLIVEWVAKNPTRLKKGATYAEDRIQVHKVRVIMSDRGDVLRIRESDVWLQRNTRGDDTD